MRKQIDEERQDHNTLRALIKQARREITDQRLAQDLSSNLSVLRAPNMGAGAGPHSSVAYKRLNTTGGGNNRSIDNHQDLSSEGNGLPRMEIIRDMSMSTKTPMRNGKNLL